jgi:hypothetical protein
MVRSGLKTNKHPLTPNSLQHQDLSEWVSAAWGEIQGQILGHLSSSQDTQGYGKAGGDMVTLICLSTFLKTRKKDVICVYMKRQFKSQYQ